MKEFGIILFGHSRPTMIADVLKSLEKQDALKHTDVWLDGHQGAPDVKQRVELVRRVVERFPVAKVHAHNGALGFRKLVLQALIYAVQTYENIVILEDDCFPTRDAVAIMRKELQAIVDDPKVFSLYGHPFLVAAEGETCTRFQGWGWATTAAKLAPHLEKLVELYSVTEERYLAFVQHNLTDAIKARIDITPPRQPSATLPKFFAWDETLGLLTALEDQVHKKTSKRVIFNCGATLDSSRFKNVEWYMKPPFNMISPDDVWKHF